MVENGCGLLLLVFGEWCGGDRVDCMVLYDMVCGLERYKL